MQISLSDVAARAGVSAATVSRVLNGKEEDRIPETTRVRVKQAASDLNYRPNRMARGLQARRSMNIGIVVHGLRNPLFAELFDTLESLIIDAGYGVLPDTRRGKDETATGLFRGWPVDGVLMWAVAHQRMNPGDENPAQQAPVVYMGHPRNDSADFISHDTLQGTRLALRHLLERGHRRIAFASPDDLESPSRELRREGYLDFCRTHALRPHIISVASASEIDEASQDGFRRSGFEAGLRFARLPHGERPTAVFCYNDLTALGFLNALLGAGVRIPEEIAVIGFDGLDEGLYQVKPLTTAVIPVRQICEQALELLLLRMSGEKPKPARQVILPMTLRTGATT